MLVGADRRMEAENYLAAGFRVRATIKAKTTGWTRLDAVAQPWQPSRLKGILVDRSFGTPFLAATQVFDLRPVPRKWLSLDRTEDAGQRFVTSGTILVTCSGSVGRTLIANKALEKILVSHDLLRIEPTDKRWRGWLYAYLRSSQVREMMLSAQYGHIIKHLETTHLAELPVVSLPDTLLDEYNEKARRIIELRDRADDLSADAEGRFASAFGKTPSVDNGEAGFTVKASKAFVDGRRRFDASNHNPAIATLDKFLARHATAWTPLSDLGFDIWLPSRFRRIAAPDGVEFLDSADLFEINPDITKRIADGDFGDPHKGRVKRGWILLARSGQVYGINGSAILAAQEHEGKVISDHVIRIAPRQNEVMSGFVFVALTHPMLGRPRVKALPYGSSIPEIEPFDLARLRIPRLRPELEKEIALLALEAAGLRSDADLLERRIGEEASLLVSDFIGDKDHNKKAKTF